MKKILIINGGQRFAHSEGRFNHTLTEWTTDYFKNRKGYEVRITNISEGFIPEEEVDKFIWAHIIIYHTPIWWFGLPHDFKRYFDVVLTAGHKNGIYLSDGRRSANPTRNYGTGGSLQGRKYMLTTTWNAPKEAFNIENEFFNKHSVDEGVMFGFHRMNEFIGMSKLESFHFYDVMKNPNIDEWKKEYTAHLAKIDEPI